MIEKKQDYYFKEVWFVQEKVWSSIYKDLLKVIHQNRERIETSNFKKEIIHKFKIDEEVLDYLYSFQDNWGSLFDHKIRYARTSLKTKGFLINKPIFGYTATTKLNNQNLEIAESRINNFFDRTKSILLLNQKFIISPKETTNFKQRMKTSKMTREDIEKDAYIIRLRNKFRQAIDAQKINIEKINNLSISTFIENPFQFPQRAHILSVEYLARNHMFGDIVNPNNGIIVDPNTHILFDNKAIIFNDNYQLVWKNTGKIYANINNMFLNYERKSYIKKYIEKMQ